VNPF
jgi:hypothetical protein